MAKQKEGSLQERVQKLIVRRGGYIHKNWGNMTTAPGIADLTVCYKGIYIVFECKVDNNEPSRQQGIHCRLVRKANGLTAIVWHTNDVEEVLNTIDYVCEDKVVKFVDKIDFLLSMKGVENGTDY